MLANGIKRVYRTRGIWRRFGNKQGVPRLLILPSPLREVREVNVRRQEINLRRAGSPDVHEVRQRPGARILAGLMAGTDERRVHIHRQLVFGCAALSHLIRVTRKVPRHENLVRLSTRSENFLPCAASFEPGGGPLCAKLWNQSLLVLAKVIHQLGRHGFFEKFLCDGAAIARVRNHSDLVLDLHHDDRVVVSINFAQVAHEGRERARVRAKVFLAERRKDFHPASHRVL